VGANRFFLLTVTFICSGILLSGCSNFRRDIGLERTAPDEFAVESRAPLTIPPDFDLRPPQPGAARPQEVTADEKARKAIDSAGPGEPGKQATAALRAPQGGSSGTGTDGQDVGDNSLSNKLLGYRGTGSTAVEKRETTVMKDVY
jgi:hypothetical protein